MLPVIAVPSVTEVSHGVRVAALSREFLRSSSLVVLLGTGSYTDPVSGCACLCNRMKLRLTSKLSSFELQKTLDQLGATMDIATDRDLMLLRAQVPAKNTETCLQFLAELLTSPSFNPSEVDKEKAAQTLEYEKERQDPFRASIADTWEATFPSNPLGNPVTGYPETIRNLSPPMLEEFDAKARTRAPLIIGIVGPQDEEMLVDYARSSFSEIETEGRADAHTLGSRCPFNVMRRDLNVMQTTYSVGIVAPGVSSSEFPALLMTEDYLGSARRYTGVLWDELREKRGLTYFVGSRVNAFRDCGLLVAYAGAEHDKVLDGIGLMLDTISTLRDTPIEDELLAELKAFHEQIMGVALEVPSQTAAWLAQSTLREGDVDFDSYMAKVNSVSPAAIQDAAKNFLKPSNVAISVAGRPPSEESLQTTLKERIG